MLSSTIYIVIPVHNNIRLTLKCLASLQSQSYPTYEIIIVNDGSTDGTYEAIQERFSEVTVLKGDGNLWWAGGTNMGIEYVLEKATNEDFVLTLNNDLEVNADYLGVLVETYQLHKPCLVGSVSVYHHNPDRIDYAGTKWNPYTAKSRPSVPETSYAALLKNHQVITTDTLPGRGTLIPVSLFKEIGLFNAEQFPQYLADYDFSRRALYHGYKLLIASKAVVRSVVENTGYSYKLKPSWSVFFTSLKSIKSPNKISVKYQYGKLHSPIKGGYIVVSFVRILLSFLREWVRYKMTKTIKGR